ncbi:MAG: hypothetical protein K5945_09150 [Bacteroidaceae bacterium]|nr:hypothetical protein [Bacteroidaceae bacterium]
MTPSRIPFPHILVVTLVLLLLGSCHEADRTYCNLPAHFAMDNIYQAPVLYTACNSMGQFCTITPGNKTFIFASTTKTSVVNQTAMTNYTGFYLGLSGFIVGLPEIPELGRDESRVVCFDLACANCYHEFGITKRLELQEGGWAYCKSCERTYNLNDLGRTDKGRPLYRYRVSLVGNALIIANN